MPTEFWAAILGAVVGAVVGGLVAYVVQLKALREVRSQRDEDRRLGQQALGRALLLKTTRIYSDFADVSEDFEGYIKSAKQHGHTGNFWMFYEPMAVPPDRVEFTYDEMGMILSLDDDDVFNLVHAMDMRHNSLITAIQGLHCEWSDLVDRLPGNHVSGMPIETELTPDQALAVRPKMNRVNIIILEIAQLTAQLRDEAARSLLRLNGVLGQRLGLVHNMTLDRPNRSHEAQASADASTKS